MPFKSQAQRAKFYALKAQGKMTQATIDEWESHTPASLPARVSKPTAKRAPRKTTKRGPWWPQ